MTIETERETDGRWLAEVLEVPGALAYGTTQAQAVAQAKALALRGLAERLDDVTTLLDPAVVAEIVAGRK